MRKARARGGAGRPDGQADQLDISLLSDRGLDRGALTTLPIEDIVIGKDLYLAAVDTGHLPFILQGIAVQGSDSALGLLTVLLYRIDREDVLPGSWTAHLSAYGSGIMKPSTYEYLLKPSQAKEIDRGAAAWLVGVFGSTDTMTVRGCASYTMPSFSAWKKSPGAAQLTIVSGEVSYDLHVPSIGLLTQAGVRLRGTGIIG